MLADLPDHRVPRLAARLRPRRGRVVGAGEEGLGRFRGPSHPPHRAVGGQRDQRTPAGRPASVAAGRYWPVAPARLAPQGDRGGARLTRDPTRPGPAGTLPTRAALGLSEIIRPRSTVSQTSQTTSDVENGEIEYPILPVLADRWSPRAYLPVDIDQSKLNSAFEAARWSPSWANNQPWAYVVGRRGSGTFDTIVDTLVDFNQGWASKASALILTIALTHDGDGQPRPTALYDLGQSVAHFTVQAHAEGLSVRQMGGFHADRARASFGLDDHEQPVSVIAVGTVDPEGPRASKPRTRKPQRSFLRG
ncbi:hypothetical protein CGZ91_10660 [Parenemella sanctibonifatiensis]|uniref:Nitroreductase domain-containing protein n=1 Tax=Parenemella sanctibonifatiensis TaxID=2016505 RepID=A0A255ECT3_9ACTN|nr:hypothetical protein CGZ91_10660 [Parenemella sanctibonifatiensis]